MQQWCGAVLDSAITDEACLRLSKQGKEPLFGDAMPQFKGSGRNKTILMLSAEEALFGRTLNAFTQNRGTCVGQGTARAIQLSLYWHLAFGEEIGKPIFISPEYLYGGARIQIRRGSLGRGDGAVGADAAMMAHEYGILCRGVYGTIDLSGPREDLAVQWGEPGHGVPAVLVTEASKYKSAACFLCKTIEDCEDALISGHALALCSNSIFSDTRDSDGMCRWSSTGAHCRCIGGMFIDKKGRRVFVEYQSWGDYPRGGGKWKLSNGNEVQPPQGAYGIFSDSLQRQLDEGECWAVSPPKTAWRSGITPAEIA